MAVCARASPPSKCDGGCVLRPDHQQHLALWCRGGVHGHVRGGHGRGPSSVQNRFPRLHRDIHLGAARAHHRGRSVLLLLQAAGLELPGPDHCHCLPDGDDAGLVQAGPWPKPHVRPHRPNREDHPRLPSYPLDAHLPIPPHPPVQRAQHPEVTAVDHGAADDHSLPFRHHFHASRDTGAPTYAGSRGPLHALGYAAEVHLQPFQIHQRGRELAGGHEALGREPARDVRGAFHPVHFLHLLRGAQCRDRSLLPDSH
mmetsp:Transcript_61330/g.197623  ORF Transcript_61330/g.197623 Transcript_61330/m.197623 type:complete len:256 (+) Transcript_61330:129-896(+)